VEAGGAGGSVIDSVGDAGAEWVSVCPSGAGGGPSFGWSGTEVIRDLGVEERSPGIIARGAEEIKRQPDGVDRGWFTGRLAAEDATARDGAGGSASGPGKRVK
jgi:hypothetical protein